MIVAATSSAVPTRRIGTVADRRCARPGSPELAWISVSINPGRTALTRMPSAPTSLARPIVKRVDRPLARRVVDVLVGAAQVGSRRRDVDDRTTVSAVARRHPSHGFAGTHERADHVDVEHLSQAPVRVGVEASLAVDDPGVVDEDARRPERGRPSCRTCVARRPRRRRRPAPRSPGPRTPGNHRRPLRPPRHC